MSVGGYRPVDDRPAGDGLWVEAARAGPVDPHGLKLLADLNTAVVALENGASGGHLECLVHRVGRHNGMAGGATIDIRDRPVGRDSLDRPDRIGSIDDIQERVQGQVASEWWTHGSSAPRVEWFNRGYETGDPLLCDTFA